MGRLYIAEQTLNSVNYDHDTKTLEVDFPHQGIYQYVDVSFHVYQGLMAAENKQYYLERYVINEYAFTKIYG
ncbi:TPA: KTSC domain-containing protein [Providencia alcalifaciens]|nr:KTSC domain-containing protein [Providencia alcalifaciens]